MTQWKSRWAVQLQGDHYDIAVLAKSFSLPGDPWIESTDESNATLRSTAWDEIDDGRAVHSAASVLVDRINGGLQLCTPGPQPIKLGGLIETKADGANHPSLILEPMSLTISMGRVFTKINDEPNLAIHGDLRKVVNAAEDNEIWADLLEHLKRADNWFDLYKVTEKVHDLAGGEPKWLEKLGEDASRWRRAKRTCNWHRHSKGHGGQEFAPMPTFAEARNDILTLARRIAQGR